ncbi:30S ribosomal protein S9 [Runella sp. MFBS21]|uniref:30S ribosomal protein S9 n=1 Tax=Runella sp. MFBS21 TaxID=3034018 RepID=UPI0023F7D155|nr:30S ribosomal protein S9 [Runella sp. MFBS21]MDF7816382.1 30S ribosomal protein S9 [Runella sp. MFBS21]
MEVTNTVGRRKTSVARVYVSTGQGEIKVNGREFAEYFPVETLQIILKQPLTTVNAVANYDIKVNVRGGGIRGQAEATRMAIARALCEINNDFRPALKKEGFLTRDARMVERKKYGRAKARRRFQFSKR